MRSGVKYRILVPESLRPSENLQPGTAQGLVVRKLPEIPLIMGVKEEEAGVFFRFIGGRADYAGFYADDPTAVNWARDLFMHYWEKTASFRTV